MKKVLAWFAAVTLLTQVIGLYVGYQYLLLMKEGLVPPLVEQPSKPSNAIIIFAYVLVVTACVLLAIKFLKRKDIFLRGLEAFAVFFSSWIAFDVIVPFGIIPAVLIVAWRLIRPNAVNKAIAAMFAIIGAGAVIGASLEVVPAMLLVLLLSSYDFVSVFITKHMVYMARAIVETDSAFTFSFPHKFKKPVIVEKAGRPVKLKEHAFQLGGGDVLLPLIFSVSVLRQFSLVNALFSLVGSVVALVCLFYYVSRHIGRPLPALPVISAGMLFGFTISMLL
jgi:presenilin-like A22 family membrane protease